MAIALTLLTIDLRLHEPSHTLTLEEFIHALGALVPKIFRFLISFMVISIYWVSHHCYFKNIVRYDSRLVCFNLIFLLSIAFIPFVAGLMGQYYYLPIISMLYAGSIAFTGFSMSAIWFYASSNKHRLVSPDLEDDYIRIQRIILIIGLSIFLLSIPLGLINNWFLITAWWLSPILYYLMLRKAENQRKPLQHKQWIIIDYRRLLWVVFSWFFFFIALKLMYLLFDFPSQYSTPNHSQLPFLNSAGATCCEYFSVDFV